MLDGGPRKQACRAATTWVGWRNRQAGDWRTRVRGEKQGASLLTAKTFDGLVEGGVVRGLLQGFVPYLVGVVAAIQGPQHFAEMGGNLGILALLVRLFQMHQGTFRVVAPEANPPHAVKNVGVVRGEFKRISNQLFGFVKAHASVGKSVAQCVVSVRVIRFELNQ